LLTCEELDADPNGEPPFDARLVKALDRQLRRVDSAVELSVDQDGCFCHGFAAFRARPQSNAQNLTTTSSSSSTSLDCSDCFFSVSLYTPVELAVVEVEVDFWYCFENRGAPGMRLDLGGDWFSTYVRLHGGVVEECDDGNPIDGDGCSAACTIESPHLCHYDAGSSACEGSCASGGECVAAGDAQCACTTDLRAQCRSVAEDDPDSGNRAARPY
jgi:cysteine-rich repeat protein